MIQMPYLDWRGLDDSNDDNDDKGDSIVKNGDENLASRNARL